MKPADFRASVWMLLTAVIAALAPAPHAPASGTPSGPIVTLGEKTVLSATRHSHALLKVPEDVPLTQMKSFVEGGGRVAGFVLTNSTQEPEEDDFVVYSLTFNRCTKPGCPRAEDPLPTRVSSGLTNNVIPAGTYDLYIVADRAPVVVTFKDKHLSGERRIRLGGGSVEVELRTLPTTVGTGDGTVFSGGDFTALEPGRGIGMLGLWARGEPYAAAAFGNCFYFGNLLVVRRDTAFLPGCPTGSSAHHYPRVSSDPTEYGGVVYQSTYQEVPTGIGGWVSSAGVIDDFGAVALWLRF